MISNIKELRTRLGIDILDHHKIFIIGHNSPDFDSIASCMGIYNAVLDFNRDPYIVLDDEPSKIEPGVKKILDKSQDEYNFINREECLKLVDSDSLLIVCDTNKKNMISLGNDLDKFDSVFVIDHHETGEDTIPSKHSFISLNASSTSEIVTRVLSGLKIPYSKEVANYLLAGISLDTKRFKRNTTSTTHDVAEKLINNGADIDYVNNLFLEEFDSFCRISSLIINGTVIKKYSDSLLDPIQVSFTLNRNQPNSIYLKEDYAKAADRMMKFNGIDAAFALGFVEPDIVHISARSGKRVNVGAIMNKMKGGGTFQSAGGRIHTNDLFGVEEQLMNYVSYGISDDENIKDEPQVVKIQQIKKR